VPDSVTAVTRELLSTCPGIQILTTARRRLTERLGVNREIQPLPAAGPAGPALAHDPAVELVLRHAGADSWASADLTRELPLVAELGRRLGRLPRYLEFAAERLRTIPVRLLLAHGPTKEMLWSNDHALLPHQRSLVGSLRWDMDLLTEDHRRLLAEIAAWPARRFTVDDIMSASGARATAATAPLALLSDLLETSLIVADPRDKYRYRLAPYVAEVAAQLTWAGGGEGHELPAETLAVGF
jgi:predicted ATPase